MGIIQSQWAPRESRSKWRNVSGNLAQCPGIASAPEMLQLLLWQSGTAILSSASYSDLPLKYLQKTPLQSALFLSLLQPPLKCTLSQEWLSHLATFNRTKTSSNESVDVFNINQELHMAGPARLNWRPSNFKHHTFNPTSLEKHH